MKDNIDWKTEYNVKNILMCIFWFVVFIGLIAMLGHNDEPKWKLSTPDWCIDYCVKDKFKSFHASGKSWGTSSSSMNGLSQDNIFKEVVNYCHEFIETKKCYCHTQFNGFCEAR